MSETIDFDALYNALTRGEYLVHYQPIVALADGRCIGAEALIRWQRGDRILPASEFISVANGTPLSGPITYRVLETVQAELGPWLKANPDARVHINVPPEILGRGGLEYVGRTTGLIDLAHQLVIELTEESVPDPIGLAGLNHFHLFKVRLALDDVRLSGANLAVITRCNFDIVKIDLSAVAQIVDGSPLPQWLDWVTSSLQATGIEYIAEGIETETQYQALKAAGVPLGQGFYFSRALPAERFVDFHARTNGAPG